MSKPNDEVAGDVPPDQVDGYDPGFHNKNLPESTTRVIHGGTWKKQDTIVLLPAATMVPLKCAMSWWGLIFPANNGVVKIGLTGQEVGEAYSNAINMILENPKLSKFKYILTVEHDNTPPQDGVLRLMKRMETHPEYSAISGLYWTKGEGGAPQIWGDINDPVLNFRPQAPSLDGGLVECCGIGMGFALWRLDMFKDERIKRPWFRTLCSVEEGVGTQDLTFWTEARKWGYRCAVDCGCCVGHFDHETGINW